MGSAEVPVPFMPARPGCSHCRTLAFTRPERMASPGASSFLIGGLLFEDFFVIDFFGAGETCFGAGETFFAFTEALRFACKRAGAAGMLV